MNKQKQIKMITKEKIQFIQKFLQEQVAEIEERENVKFDFGTITYTAGNYKCQMKVTSTEITPKVENYNKALSTRYGFTQNIIGMEFQHPKLGTVTISDIKTRNRKYPIIGDSSKGLINSHQIKLKDT